MSAKTNHDQGELFGIIWRTTKQPTLLCVNDVIRIGDRIARVIRINECSAVVIMRRPVRQFTTRFDKRVRFQPPPAMFRISPNSEVEILNRNSSRARKRVNHPHVERRLV